MAYRDPPTGKFSWGQSRDPARFDAGMPTPAPDPAFDPAGDPPSDIPWWQAGLLACAIVLIIVAVLIARNP